MTKSVNTLLAEAEQIMAKHASQKPEKTDSSVVLKLAEQLRKTQGEEDPNTSLTVKIAEAIAIVDTLINLEQIVKVAHFEGQARNAGYDEAQIADFIEKKASPKFVSVVSMIPWLNRG